MDMMDLAVFLIVALVATFSLLIFFVRLYLKKSEEVRRNKEEFRKKQAQQREIFCEILSDKWNAPIPKINRAFIEFGLANINFTFWTAEKFHEWFNEQVLEYGETLGYIHSEKKGWENAARHVDDIFK